MRVIIINAHPDEAKRIATRIALVSDWEAFESLDGWRNVDPQLPKKIADIAAGMGKKLELRGGPPHDKGTHKVSQAIARARQ